MQNNEIELDNDCTETIVINNRLELSITAKKIGSDDQPTFFFSVEAINRDSYNDSMLLESFDISPKQYIIDYDDDDDYDEDDDYDCDEYYEDEDD